MPQLALTLFNDISNRRLIQGLKNGADYTVASPFHQDYISIQYFGLKLGPNSNPLSAAYETVDLSNTSVDIHIWNSDGSIALANVVLAAASRDANGALNGALNLKTTEMNMAMGSASSISNAILEIEATDSAGALTVYQQTGFTIKREYTVSGSPTATPTNSYLTENQCKSLFAKLIGDAGASITLISPDGTKSAPLYVANDGTFHSDVL